MSKSGVVLVISLFLLSNLLGSAGVVHRHWLRVPACASKCRTAASMDSDTSWDLVLALIM